MKIEKKGTQYIYSWNDDLGLHQYYCEDLGYKLEENSIRDFQRTKTSSGVMYSWNDDLGLHQYYLNL
jgi:hypothetical protein